MLRIDLILDIGIGLRTFEFFYKRKKFFYQAKAEGKNELNQLLAIESLLVLVNFKVLDQSLIIGLEMPFKEIDVVVIEILVLELDQFFYIFQELSFSLI